MKRLLTSSSIVALFAIPAFAQTDDAATSMSDQTQAEQSAQMDETSNTSPQTIRIELTTLLDRRVYMPEGNDRTDQSDAQNSASTADGDTGDHWLADLPGSVNDVPENWRMVGEINDILIAQSGQISSVIVDSGGFLGMNENSKQIDMSELRFVRDSNDDSEYYVVFNGDRSKLEQQANYDANVAAEQEMFRMTEQEGMQEYESEMEEIDLADVTTERLLGAAAYGTNDNWVGEVSELSLAENGKIDAVIVDVGGFLGIGEKAVSLSMDQIKIRRVNGDELRAYVSASEDELDSMEAFSAEES